MKRIILSTAALAFSLFTLTAHANDGGVYSVVPFGAKYDKASHSFSFTGQYAQEFKKLLPPAFSVLTGMQPELKNAYEKNFRGIQMKDAAGNALVIDCSSAGVEYGENNKSSIKEKPETSCTVTLMDKASMEGDSMKVQVKDALQKAQDANRLP